MASLLNSGLSIVLDLQNDKPYCTDKTAHKARAIVAKKPTKKQPDNRIQIRVTATWLARVNAYRRGQPDIPNMSEAIRRLVEAGLEKSARYG